VAKFKRLGSVKGSDVAEELLSIVQKEKVDLWVDCSTNALSQTLSETKDLIERRTACACFTTPEHAARSFSSPESFLALSSRSSLPVPDSHQVRSRDDIHKVLNRAHGKRYTLTRTADTASPAPSVALLPRRTPSQTYNEIAKMTIEKHGHWSLEQHLDGLQRFETLSIVVNGEVEAFAASEDTSWRTYRAVPLGQLRHVMLRYVRSLAHELGRDVNCHMRVDFCVDENAIETGVMQQVLPFAGRLAADSLGLLFQGEEGSVVLARAYLTSLSGAMNGSRDVRKGGNSTAQDNTINATWRQKEVFSLGTEIVRFCRTLPSLSKPRIRPSEMAKAAMVLTKHMLYGKEAVYDFSDPLPFFYLYQIYLPIKFFLLGLNSTNKRSQSSAETMRMIS
jgi:catechol O-methyltransferase